MTVEAAKDRAASWPKCGGFTFKGQDRDGPVQVEFLTIRKSLALSEGNWTSYRKENFPLPKPQPGRTKEEEPHPPEQKCEDEMWPTLVVQQLNEDWQLEGVGALKDAQVLLQVPLYLVRCPQIRSLNV
mmetsp:Transcript_33039/g.84379  ORF Transcript_33039/g.84379 Transcript_33039/m.84379 type:complete len:128 (+) Transcript_33039:1166-1549(+)